MISESVFLLFSVKHIMKVNNVILKLYMAFCNVAHEFVEYISTIFIKYILKKGLSQTNLTYLIKLLEGRWLEKSLGLLKHSFGF